MHVPYQCEKPDMPSKTAFPSIAGSVNAHILLTTSLDWKVECVCWRPLLLGQKVNEMILKGWHFV